MNWCQSYSFIMLDFKQYIHQAMQEYKQIFLNTFHRQQLERHFLYYIMTYAMPRHIAVGHKLTRKLDPVIPFWGSMMWQQLFGQRNTCSCQLVKTPYLDNPNEDYLILILLQEVCDTPTHLLASKRNATEKQTIPWTFLLYMAMELLIR